ncbi:hypothetical protein CLOLEP_00858 [[Clostridium] leptum DSM 753]|uniref:Uncharacterized protein n=2 Tax=[Clostridium] leptum DSM 753 TaxID=428125 RepID=A7VQM8_9FIRM|nr:hypothetical protein CLOLEP_00858 [[Clostridium] leptum DSM 753]
MIRKCINIRIFSIKQQMFFKSNLILSDFQQFVNSHISKIWEQI